MKTVKQIVDEYKKALDGNVTTIHKFKVGDKVETTPDYDLLHEITNS